MIGCLHYFVRSLVLILPKISGNVKTFKDKGVHKDKTKNNKLLSFHIDHDELLEKYKNHLD